MALGKDVKWQVGQGINNTCRGEPRSNRKGGDQARNAEARQMAKELLGDNIEPIKQQFSQDSLNRQRRYQKEAQSP